MLGNKGCNCSGQGSHLLLNFFNSTSRLEGALDVVRVEGEAAKNAGIVSTVDREEVAALSEGSAAEGNFFFGGLDVNCVLKVVTESDSPKRWPTAMLGANGASDIAAERRA